MKDIYEKEEDITYFKKTKKTTIDEVNEGEVVYLKVRSTRKYGLWELEYYGRLIKKTNDYFYILLYTYYSDNLETEYIKMHEENPKEHTKKWAKSRIKEIYKVKCQEKKVLVKYHNYVDDIDSIKDI